MHSAYNDKQEYDDDLDSPTEPMMRIVLVPHAPPPSPVDNDLSAEPTAPLKPATPFASTPHAPRTPQIYPVLPAAPLEHLNGNSPGGAAYTGNGNAVPTGSGGVVGATLPRRSLVPGIVGVCFVAVQVLLLARVLLLLFSVSSNQFWAGVFYTTSSIFVLPFRLLFDHIQPVARLGPDVISYLAPLIAILIYGLISRILVRFLKALMNSR